MNLNSNGRCSSDEVIGGYAAGANRVLAKPQHASVKSLTSALTEFDFLPDTANVRLPVVKALYGCSSATIWRAVKSGHVPSPRRLTPRITAWNVGELRAALAKAR
ncbi:MAG: AlpA family phage regulatory protein [Sterolibacterium sp.]